jgi:hypothetical protein
VVINEGDWLKRSNANLEPSAVVQRLACNGVGGADGGGSGMLVVSLNYRMGPFGATFQMAFRNKCFKNLNTGKI